MSEFQNILAFDTALQGCSVGVCAHGKVFTKAEPMTSGQGEKLVPMINEVLAEARLTFKEIDAIVTTLGPGAFTGLRIGLSAAKAFGLSLDKPVFGITTLQALALQYAKERSQAHPLAVILESKREDFYFQTFSNDAKPDSDARAISGAEITKIVSKGDHVLIGDGVERFARPVTIEAQYLLIDAGFIAKFFYENKNTDVFTKNLEPVYLRGADVTTPKKQIRPLIVSS
jgi:tRNA threonylcarbamoyladenosine biosynthesis protein TsaB